MTKQSVSQALLELPGDVQAPAGNDGSAPHDAMGFAASFQAALAKAIEDRKRAEAEAAELQRQRELAENEVEAARLRRDAIASRAAAAALEIETAAKHERLVRRSEMPPAITEATAREIGEGLVKAFADFAGSSRQGDDVQRFWVAVDELNWRTCTAEVSEEARLTVLRIDAVMDAISEWERYRRHLIDGKPIAEANATGEANDAPEIDRVPGDNKIIANLLQELADHLRGVEKPRRLETLGQLLTENVSPSQIALMIGLRKIDGQPDPSALGTLIDIALRQAGFHELYGSGLVRFACPSLDTAWAARSQLLAFRRENIVDRRERHWRGEIAVTRDENAGQAAAVVFHRTVAQVEQARRERLEKIKADRRQRLVENFDLENELQ